MIVIDYVQKILCDVKFVEKLQADIVKIGIPEERVRILPDKETYIVEIE